ncbi:hypothetical protein P9274_20135 [Schinkia azotoformans]|uniref:hypothetical protein n=1 Tax=Schinkia azotoformans TaxID=1454 RepID=UPI002E1B219D|nr:hypothetical protein [Schinkia azotoformans]
MPDWIVQLVFGLLIGIISYFLKSFKSQLDKNDEQQHSQIELVKADLNQYKLEAAERFVQKDDFIRATAVTDRKLDRIYDELMRINKRNVEDKT